MLILSKQHANTQTDWELLYVFQKALLFHVIFLHVLCFHVFVINIHSDPRADQRAQMNKKTDINRNRKRENELRGDKSWEV